MREIVQLWLKELYRLTVLLPAWLLTPEGRKALFSGSLLWRAALMLVFAIAIVALAQTLPVDLALLGAGDVVAYVEVAVIAWVAGAGALVRSAAAWVKRRGEPGAMVAARRGRRTAIRRSGRKRPSPPANDDAPGRRWTVAA